MFGLLSMWYSFNYGIAHFIVTNTETDVPGSVESDRGPILPSGHFGKEGEYLAWLENDLKKANEDRHLRPWIFVAGHRPIYSGIAHDYLIAAVEELFHKYKVDLYFSGHEHSYTRTYPVYKQQVVKSYESPNATAFVVVGGAGCDESTAEGPDDYDTSAEWIKLHDHHYGTGVLEVINRTAVRWKYIKSDDLSLKDEFVLTK
mmetsp:Transcript_9651/g.17624  ORF Transcript_9651/g.17624 Transcript_9651/m.17624 type:complete len:202 (-) Transcript_9651:49-654(-)